VVRYTTGQLGHVPIIGLLIDWIGDPYQLSVLEGASRAAASSGARLLCFVGGPLVPPGAPVESGNWVYELASPMTLDAVLVLGTTLSHHVGPEGLAQYCKRFDSLPLVSIGVGFEGAASLTVDNSMGMSAAVEHLITAHGARRIAFVRGPEANDEANVRLQAYQEVLARHGIPFEPRLVVVGNFMANGGAAAVGELAKRGIELRSLDAIVASNDGMAVGVMGALEERGIDVPTVRVVGFDDVEEARLTRPPLTTVRQPIEKLGRIAFMNALHGVRHGVPADERLATELVVRRSCGCGYQVGQIQSDTTKAHNFGFDAALLMNRQQILDELTRVARGELGAIGSGWQTKLLTVFVDELRGTAPGGFLPYLQEIADSLSHRGGNVALGHELLDVLRSRILSLIPPQEATQRAHAEDIVHQARLSIGDAMQQSVTRQHLLLSRWMRAFHITLTGLLSCDSYESLAQAITSDLPNVGLRRCFVSLHEATGNQARLFCGYDRTTSESWTTSEPFARDQILPREVHESLVDNPSLTILPLAWHDRLYGHMAVELDIHHGYAYAPLAQTLGAALHALEVSGHLSGEDKN